MRKTTLAIVGTCLACGLPGCGPPPTTTPPGEPLETRVQRLPWTGPGVRGVQIQTPNYAIYTTVQGGQTVLLLPGFMEASYRNYLRILGLPDRPVGKRMDFYLLATREEWASLTRTVMGANAGKYLQIEGGGYCHQGVCVFWELGGLWTLQIAGHEGLHQFIHHRLADQLPMWLEEGLCTQAEAHEVQEGKVWFDPNANLSRRGDLERAILHGFWIPLEALLPMDAGDAVGPYVEQTVGYYGQLWAMIRFIRSDPAFSAGLDRLIADADAGRLHQAIGVPKEALAQLRRNGRAYNQTVSEKLFRHYIADDLPAFEKRYKEFCYKATGLK